MEPVINQGENLNTSTPAPVKKRGRPAKKKLDNSQQLVLDVPVGFSDIVSETPTFTKEIFDFPKKDTYEEPEWVYYVKRSENPNQIIRMLAHVSFAEYSKNNSKTEHNSLSIVQLEQTLRVDDSFYKVITDAFKEATSIDKQESQEALLNAIKTRSIKSLEPLYAGLKTVTLVISEDANKGTVVSFNAVVACQDGTYELTVNLL